MQVLQHKVVSSLPVPLQPNSIYYVRKGIGFDIHVTNDAGVVVAYSLNANLELDGKVDKELGYSLLPNTEITRLATMSTGATKNRADSENADEVHTHTADQVSGLGTAATKNVGDNAGDVMEVGTFGYGGENPVNNTYDVNDLSAGQRLSLSDEFTEADAVALNLPALGGSGTTPRSWHVECTGSALTRLVQIATEVYGQGTTKGRTFIRVKHGATWYLWQEVPIANVDGKLSTNWLKTDVSTDPLSVTDVVLTRGAHGIGDVGTHANFPTPTSLMYNSFWSGNCIFINSKESPYGSMIVLQKEKMTFGSINNDDGIWGAEVITDKNQVVLGKTAKSARQALGIMDEGDGWVDLRPYLLPPFYWDTVREGRNSHPRIRKLPSGRVELDGVVSWNETPAAPQNGIAFRVPPEFRPVHTTAGVSFVDSTPLYFGTGQWIMTGEVEYSNGLHGEMMLILGNPPAISQGVFGLNGVGWFTD